MTSVGVDIIEIERVEHAVDRWGDRFLSRVFTEGERYYCQGQCPELAARFAAKEAISKALGTGIGDVTWQELEIICDEAGKPHVHLHGRARDLAGSLGLEHLAVSLSHSEDYAIALVLAE